MVSLLELHKCCVSRPAEMSSMSFCHSCKAETKYICLIYQGTVCNRPECAVFPPEGTPNWKSGSSVSAYLPYNTGSKLKRTANDTRKQAVSVISPQTSNDQSAGAKLRKKAAQTTGAKETAKRNCLSLKQRVEMINYAKGVILTQYENNMQSCKKRVPSAKYLDVNEALWEWYTRCRESNIPVDGTMLQEEALLIAEKLGISGFTASNGWLQRFKQLYNH